MGGLYDRLMYGPPGYYQQRPPPKRGMGAGAWVAIVLVVAILPLSMCGLVMVRSSSPERLARNRAIDEQIQADAEKAKQAADAQKAARDAKLRKACKVDAALHEPNTEDFKLLCRVEVKAQLKSPDSAEFPPLADPDPMKSGLTTDDGCRFNYDSWVDALNPFGVKMRTAFRCTYDPRTDLVKVTLKP